MQYGVESLDGQSFCWWNVVS